MKERPILFSGSMVRALLDGSKRQTRRVCKPAQFYSLSTVVEVPDPMERGQVYNGSHFGDEDGEVQFACPYGGRGDRLWVRETFCKIIGQSGGWIETDFQATYTHGFRLGDSIGLKKRWTPSIHMPRDASRITLEITSVRVERLQDISEADAMAEGIVECPIPADDEGPRRIGYMVGPDDGKSGLSVTPIHAYRDLWESINGADSWGANPWVWVIDFRRVVE